tara:strand:- start:190 stop:951 length:762 start_codon:yes stop_codon:yes gene_type:complete
VKKKYGSETLSKLTPQPKWWRYLLTYVSMFLGSTISKTKVWGKWNLPKDGPYVIACNHFSIIDPPFFTYAVQKPINFIAASDQEVDWWFMWAPFIYGWIPVDREKLNPSTIKKALKVLKNKEILGIFPDGGAENDFLGKAKNGAVYISNLAKVPIVPMAIYGAETAWEGLSKGLRPRVFVNIGKPFGPYKMIGSKKEKQKKLQEVGNDMMCRIAALLPVNRQKDYKGKKLVKKYQALNNFIPKDHLYYKMKKL